MRFVPTVRSSGGEAKNPEDPKRARYKARFVAVVCIIRDGAGHRVLERVVSTIPISLTGMGLGILWETLSEDGVCFSLDVPGAYLLSDLGGEETWLRMPKWL